MLNSWRTHGEDVLATNLGDGGVPLKWIKGSLAEYTAMLGLGFGVWGFGLGVESLTFVVEGLGFDV